MSQVSIDAVVFDMDGVLIDAKDWHFKALNDALKIFGVEIGREEHLAEFDGLPTYIKLQKLEEQGRLPRHVHKIVAAIKQERTLRTAAELCFPRVEHLLLISWLKRHGIKVGVATNSIRFTSVAMLGYAGIFDLVDVLVTNEDVVKPKPDPEIYIKTMEILGVDASRTLVVEDHEVGVQSARAAGCHVIQVISIEDVGVPLLEPFIKFFSEGGND